MSNFNIRIAGAANLSQVRAEFAKLEAQVAHLNASMERMVKIPGTVNPRGYALMSEAVKQNSITSRNAALSTGMFEVQQLRLNSATEEYTKLIQKQKLTFRDMWRERKKMSQAAYKEQMALRQMAVQQMPGTVGGKKVLDVYIPNDVHDDFDKLRSRIGFVREELRAASTQMINWGKNTQWAGRQLMVGFTMPTLAFGAATGVLAYQVDKQMTRIQKVYDTTAKGVEGNNLTMIGVEQELAKVRVDSLNTARNAARLYGQSVQDTLEVQADLAATGLKGIGLQQGTLETMRISTLGELDMSTATNMTVALQSAFRDTIKDSEDLSNAFNFMNATENATSLSINDIAEALPRAGSAMSALGVSVQEMTVLMTAMKESGVDAAEGANALKSATSAILAPSPAADAFIKQVSDGKVKIMELAEASGGNLYKAMAILFQQMQGMDKLAQQQVLTKLFGRYQFNRVSALLSNLGAAFDGTQNQTSRAMELMGASMESLSDTADNEIDKIQDSLSGRFKSTMESLKIELAEMGEPFLEIGIVILGGIKKVIEAFNGLPGGLKKAFAVTAIAAAVLGPLVMLTGLTANFGGNLLKMGIAATRAAGHMEILTKEQQAAKLAADLTNTGFVKEIDLLAMLTQEMKLLTQAAREGALAQEQFIAAATGAPIPTQTTSTRASALTNLGFGAPIAPLSPTDKDVDNSKKQSKWMAAGAASGVIMAGSMAASMVSSNKVVDSMAQWAMIVAITAPSLAGLATGLKAMGPSLAKAGTSMVNGLGNAIASVSGGVKGMALHFKGGLKSILGMISPLGWISIAVAGIAASGYLIHKNVEKGREEVKKMYEDVEALSEIIGYTAGQESVKVFDEKGNSMESLSNQGRQFAIAYSEVTAQIKEAIDAGNELRALDLAKIQGMKVINTGGTVAEAKKATKVALTAAEGEAKANEITMRFKAELDFSTAEAQIDQYKFQVDEALAESHSLDFEFDITDPFGKGRAMEEALQLAREAGKSLANAFDAAASDGIDTETNGLQAAAQKQLDIYDDLIAKEEEAGKGGNYYRLIDERRQFLESFLAGTMGDVEGYVEGLDSGADIASILADTTWLAFQNTDDGAGSAFDFADGLGKATKEAKKLTAEQRRLKAEMKAAGEVDWAGTYKDAMSATQETISDIASENFDDRMNDAMDAFSASQEARMDALENAQENASRAQDRRHERETQAFEDRWERRKSAVENAFDKRIEGVQDAIEAEQKAEEIRQRIFEAEIQRMQRMAEMLNANIDFNVAINTGELDEAAKIRNDMQAKETEWALGDAGDQSNRASEKRQQRLENRSDNLEKLKDKRLQAIEDAEEAERESLERRQEREQRFLERQQENRQNALQKEIDNNIAAQEEIWENRREKLDKAIELFQAYVPKNEKDLREHVERISKRYNDFNVDTRGKFNVTAVRIGEMLQNNVREAARAIRDEIRWAGVGDKIAKDMIRGAFGMSPSQFQDWLVTGKWPKGADINAPDYSGGGTNTGDLTPQGFGSQNTIPGDQRFHTGGIVGVGGDSGSGGFRRGHPDEIGITALKGEGVLNREAMANLGPTGFRELNSPTNKGKGVGGSGLIGLGIAGIMGAMMARALANTIGQAAINGGVAREERNAAKAAKFGGSGSFGAGGAGMYSDRYFDKNQLKHAATIASVGKGMGMSKRDIEIGIMTAITESGLVNIHGGDRDSQGLFQQRPSQGWGTVAQVTDPEYAAKAFFGALKGVGNRGDLSPWMAAQTVQRSAFSDGSNYRQYWDNAIAIYTNGLTKTAGGAGAGFVSGAGGWHKASVPGKGWSNTHDYGNGIGSPLYAASDGTITDSRAITSGGSPGNGKYSTPYRSYGETIAMRTSSGDILRYAHLSPGQRFVNAGQKVKGGSLIGRSGMTGNATGPHTHFDVNGDYNASGWMRAHGIALEKGAMNVRWDNTLANLHKGEAVLTEDINDQFRKGVDRFAEGPNAEYNLYMSVNGANLDEDALVNKTMTALRRMEQRRPQSRTGK